LVGGDNIFVYKNADETADILARGRIIARDFETSKETLGYDTPQEYWNDERVNALKERLRAGIGILKQIISYSCNAC